MLQVNYKKGISIALKSAFLRHVESDDQLQHTYSGVEGAGAALVEELTVLDGGFMTHVAFSPQLEASTTLHRAEGFLADTRISTQPPARPVKICKIFQCSRSETHCHLSGVGVGSEFC